MSGAGFPRPAGTSAGVATMGKSAARPVTLSVCCATSGMPPVTTAIGCVGAMRRANSTTGLISFAFGTRATKISSFTCSTRAASSFTP